MALRPDQDNIADYLNSECEFVTATDQADQFFTNELRNVGRQIISTHIEKAIEPMQLDPKMGLKYNV